MLELPAVWAGIALRPERQVQAAVELCRGPSPAAKS
jgi:hypothetical protein